MPFSLIPFLLLVIPILEIAVFIAVGGQIGVLATLGMILLTAIIGSILLRIQGFQVLDQLRSATNSGRVPGRELGHGVMILAAGILLLTPGFVTDTIGFLLFVPFLRDAIWSFLASRITVVTPNMGARHPFDDPDFHPGREPEDGVVDLEPDEFHETGLANKNSPWGDGRQIEDDQADRER